MPLILCECASHRFRQTPPSWTSLINVTFKSISVLKPWLVYMNSFATTLLHVRIPCSKNCSPISLLDFLHTSSIILFMKTLIMNQFIQLIQLFPHFILMIRPTFPTYFSPHFLYFYYATLKFLPQRRAHYSRKGPPAENDRRPERGPGALDYPEAARVGEHLQLLPPFLGSPGREQSEPLPMVEACKLIIPRQIRTELLY